jgi:septum formation inhibitor MinC
MTDFDAAPGIDIQRQMVQQKLSNLKQIYFEADLEIAITKAQDPGNTAEQKQQVTRQLAELARRRANAAKGAAAMQDRLDSLPPEEEKVDDTPADVLADEAAPLDSAES